MMGAFQRWWDFVCAGLLGGEAGERAAEGAGGGGGGGGAGAGKAKGKGKKVRGGRK